MAREVENYLFSLRNSTKVADSSSIESKTRLLNEKRQSEGMKVTRKSIVRPSLYISAYFAANLVLTLHTKWLLSRANFSFPWMLSALHIFISGIGAVLVVKMREGGGFQIRKMMDRRLAVKMILFSGLYSMNIAMSNVSMKYVSLALHQITRSSTPLITLALEFLILGKLADKMQILALIPVVLGIVFTVIDEAKGMEYSALGLALTLAGVFLSSLKGVMTNFMLIGESKLDPLELIALLAPLATIQCVAISGITGEIGSIYRDYQLPFGWFLFGGLLLNGFLAFFMNWISFAVNKETSALAMTVAGNVKQAVSIALAIIIFSTPLTILNAIGIIMTLIGGIFYRYHTNNMRCKQ